MLHVTKAEYVADFKVSLEFNDGSSGIVDLSGELSGEVFKPLRDILYFRGFQLEGHTLAWENGADFAPEFLQSLLPVKSQHSTP